MEKYNIYHRKDGRWEGRILKEKLTDGTRKYQYVFGRSREEVCNKIDNIRNLEPISDCILTLSELFVEWTNSIRHRIKESTASNYAMKANKHILPVFGSKYLNEIRTTDVYAFIEEKKHNGLSNRYISDIIILMKTMFKYAKKMYHILNPLEDIELPRKKKTDIRVLDHKEQKKLQRYLDNNHNLTSLGIYISMYTGIRLGELCALKWGDIDFEKRILTVNKTIQRIQCTDSNNKTKLIITEPKSESSCRDIPVPDCIISYLQRFKGNENDFVISGTDKPIEPRTMQYRFAVVLKNAKLPSIHFHALRHMFASNCINLGFDVKALSEILGHSSVEITLNRYVHSSFEQKKHYMKRLKMNY